MKFKKFICGVFSTAVVLVITGGLTSSMACPVLQLVCVKSTDIDVEVADRSMETKEILYPGSEHTFFNISNTNYILYLVKSMDRLDTAKT